MARFPRISHNVLLTWVLPAILLLWILGVVTASQLRMAPTFDEQNHVTRGIAILRTGDYRLCFHHPPLANILEGLPVAGLKSGFSTRMPAWQSLNIWDASHTTIWSDPRHGVELIQLARVPVLLFTMVLALVIFAWSRELFGPWGGLLSLSLFAFDPNMLAHSGLATTDIAAAGTIVLAMYLLRKYLYRPRIAMLILAGGGIGLALASKFSALILLPVLALVLLIFAVRTPQVADSLFAWWTRFPWWSRVGRAVGVGVLLLLVAGVVVWGVYGFKVEALGSKPGQRVAATASLSQRLPVPAMQYLRGLKAVSQEADDHRSYLLGQTDISGKGWWYYFPVAVAVKTSLPELFFIIGALVLLAIPATGRHFAVPRRELVLLLVPVGLYAVAALGLLGISLNLGIRHILPMYPFLLILAGGWVKLRVSSPLFKPALGVVLAMQCASTVMAFPNFIAYFNELSESQVDGYHILADSNCDWGQDVGALAAIQREYMTYPLTFSYFGTTPPEAYGLKYRPAAGFGLMRGEQPLDFRTYHGFFAISVTNLMGSKAYTGVDYSILQRMRPVARAGQSINIYLFR